MPTINPDTLVGQTVHGTDGEKLGKVETVYLDNDTGRPEWAAVKTGMFGGKVSLVPLATSEQSDDGLHVPFDKAQVKDAPHHDPGQELSQDDEADLFRHYGVPYGGDTVTAEPGRQAPTSGERQRPVEGQQTPRSTGDDAMTRSEEEMRVGTQRQESGRARLRKHVVTEQVSQTVPVSHDEVRVEREPITDANRDKAMAGPEITDADYEVTLHEERPVADKEVVAKERVKMSTETVTGEETVSGEVRKERIDTEGNEARQTRR